MSKFDDGCKQDTGSPVYTADGKRIKITALVAKKEHISKAARLTEGIGLLCVNSFFEGADDLPSEEEQYDLFCSIGRVMRDRQVTIRIFDWDYRYFGRDPGINPTLGLRGARLGLAQPGYLKSQLRAILRAGIYGNFNLVLPMVSHVTEVTEVKAYINEVQTELENSGEYYRMPADLGVMADIPAVVAAIEAFCFEVKFFHAGVDAISHLFAADPENPEVAGRLNYFDPAYLAQIQLLVEKAHRRHKNVCISAPLVNEPAAIPVLVGMGMDEIVVSPELVPKTRELVKCLDVHSTRLIAAKVLSYREPEKSKKYCEDCLHRMVRYHRDIT